MTLEEWKNFDKKPGTIVYTKKMWNSLKFKKWELYDVFKDKLMLRIPRSTKNEGYERACCPYQMVYLDNK